MEKRKGKRLDFEKSLSIILQAAKKARFLSYRELADANGADLSQVRYAIGGHLWKLAEYGHLKEQLLLSAIVMNKPNVETGKMQPDTLKGFIGAARELGYAITDEQVFLKEQQARMFAWAQRGQAPAQQQ